jgi:hypothetical protein
MANAFHAGSLYTLTRLGGARWLPDEVVRVATLRHGYRRQP